MKILDEITMYWSQQVSRDISKETIEVIDSKKDVFYDYDNCLNSNWEGFCVHVQEEVTVIDLDAFMEEVDALLRSSYVLLPKEEQFTLWLQTQNGKAWIAKVKNQQHDEVTPVEYEECKELLMSVLTQRASSFQSDGITRYVKYVIRGEQDEEDDFEEEEEEYED